MYNTYSLSGVAEKIIKDFELIHISSDTVRHKITDICKKTPATKDDKDIKLLDTARVKNGNKVQYFFSEQQIEEMLDNEELKDYLLKNASTRGKALLEKRAARRENDHSRDSIKKEREIRAAFFEALRSENDDPSCGYHISVNDLRAVKMEMMLEAIFRMYYKSFDEKLLEMDLWNVTFSETLPDDNNTLAEIADARQRIEKRGYYKARASRKNVKSFKKRQPRGASKRPSKPAK